MATTDPGKSADGHAKGAEELRLYWVRGEGAAKIGWGAPGDWDRCVALLSPHMGERAKGYCELRHQEATGMTTSEHAAKIRKDGNAARG
jgi:hypothetical protein